MDDMTEEFYEGISVVNNGYFYALPKTYETPAYSTRSAPSYRAMWRSSSRIFRKRSGTSESSIFCGAPTVPASFAVS